jgi:hypothetical protein
MGRMTSIVVRTVKAPSHAWFWHLQNDQVGSFSPPPPPEVPSPTLVEAEIPSDVEETISQALEERDRRAVLAPALQPKEEKKKAPCLYCRLWRPRFPPMLRKPYLKPWKNVIDEPCWQRLCNRRKRRRKRLASTASKTPAETLIRNLLSGGLGSCAGTNVSRLEEEQRRRPNMIHIFPNCISSSYFPDLFS